MSEETIRCRECEENRELEDFSDEGRERETCRLCEDATKDCLDFIEQHPEDRLADITGEARHPLTWLPEYDS
jgi:hypothetical protein